MECNHVTQDSVQ